MSRRYFEGSGKLSPAEQAAVAYREMRRSLVNFAAAEAELLKRVAEGKLTPTLEGIIVSRAHAHRDRAMMFALVYQVETNVASKSQSKNT